LNNPNVSPLNGESQVFGNVVDYTGSYFTSGPLIGRINAAVVPRSFGWSMARAFDGSGTYTETATDNDVAVWAASGKVLPRVQNGVFYLAQWGADLRDFWNPGVETAGMDENGNPVVMNYVWRSNSFNDPYNGITGWQRGRSQTYYVSLDGSKRAYNLFGRPTDIAPWTISFAQNYNNMVIPGVDLAYSATISYTINNGAIWHDTGTARALRQTSNGYAATADFDQSFSLYNMDNPNVSLLNGESQVFGSVVDYTGSYIDSGPRIGRIDPLNVPKTFNWSMARAFDGSGTYTETNGTNDQAVWATSGKVVPEIQLATFHTA
jgi:hypothetical protein